MKVINMLGQENNNTQKVANLTHSIRYKMDLLKGRPTLKNSVGNGDTIDILLELNTSLGVNGDKSVKRGNLIEDVSENGNTVILKELKDTSSIAPLAQELVSITVISKEGVLPAFEDLLISLSTTKEKLDLTGNLLYLILEEGLEEVVYVSSLETLQNQLDTVLQNKILEIGVNET